MATSSWFNNLRSGIKVGNHKEISENMDALPDGIWKKCPECNELLFIKELEKNLMVCMKCGYHFRISAAERIDITFDDNSWAETNADLISGNPLDFPEYDVKIKKGAIKSGLNDAVVSGIGKIDNYTVSCAIADFSFMGGSMGGVVGEKIVRTIEDAIKYGIPAIVFTASGGARMQEGILSLMQMAKTSAAVAKINEARLPYIVVMTDPTTAGVHASFASLGDFMFAEPGALIGFAGARVSENTGVMQNKPDDFQKPSFQLRNGMIDGIVHRKDIRNTIIKTLNFSLKEVQ